MADMVGIGSVESDVSVARRLARKAAVLEWGFVAVSGQAVSAVGGEAGTGQLLFLGEGLALLEVGAGAEAGVDGRGEDQGAGRALLVLAGDAAEALGPRGRG